MTARVGRSYQVVAALSVLLGLGAAAASLVVGSTLAELRAEARTNQIAAEGVVDIGFALRTALNDAAESPNEASLVTLGQARRQGVPLDVLVRARDTAEPALSETGGVVVARYRTARPPADVATRRRAITGVLVVPVPVRSILKEIAPAEGGIAITGPERTVAAAPAPVPSGALSYSVGLPPTLVSGWTVVTWSPPPRIPLAAWLVAAAAALAGIGIAVFVFRRGQRAAGAASDLERQRRQHETLSGLSAVAQRSLDLAEVLPAVATQLSDALGLRGLLLTAPGPVAERALFATGQTPDVAAAQDQRSTLAAGATMSILMARGGRTVARLTVTAGRDLGPLDLATLRETADVLTSAMANAEAFAQQRELLERMREVDELKTVFLATASHELRTPVGIVKGFARLLTEQVEDLSTEQIARYADRVEANAQQLSELVENLLDFSRLERGVHAGAELVPIDLGLTVSAILDQQGDLAPNHSVVAHTPPGFEVLGSVHAVERVLTNLVGNAGKYSPAGTTIRVRVHRAGDRVELVVDDEGSGVPLADREQVFSRFFRGAGDAVVGTRGAGLGLAIVREFAHAMRGQVSVAESPSGGARFITSYPAVDAPDAVAAVLTPSKSVEGDPDVTP